MEILFIIAASIVLSGLLPQKCFGTIASKINVTLKGGRKVNSSAL